MKTMPNSTQEEKFRWIKPVLDKEISLQNMAKVCPFSKRSLNYWIDNFRKYGMEGLQNKSTRPKNNSIETPIRVKERVIELRKETKLCAKKLKWKLEKEGITIHKNTIHKIIRREGLVRKYRTRKLKYKYVKVPLLPGELVEIDVKYVPDLIENRKHYQFTAIDCASRWRYLKVYESFSNRDSISFLEELTRRAPFRIRAIKTDNGSNFTNRYTGYLKSSDPLNPRLHPFDVFCQGHNIIHYLIDPGKPNQNGKVERSHRTDQEMFYDRNKFNNLQELKTKIKLWNEEYNNMEHCGLNGLSPNEFLGFSKVQNVHV
jgi:transposase InsO family protein